ncbi:DUF1648 domain-containing protein [uncultured Psychroserpens sp.]|uniref:DUF1648 domain-containing protein n=1 Tax=uncultured Psychroserpens sp. TaxID=255436 RepID=UPI002610ECA8|nr:DUF1648 domain-containing protein [uncultured Psychroserpens sp.]
MKTNRPKIEVPLELVDIILDLISLTLYILMLGYIILNYSQLPETIPTHFNASGEADGFGNKSTIWLLPALGIAIGIGLILINKMPHLHNYMVNITEDNALKNYRFSTRIVRVINFFLAVLFLVIAYMMIENGKGNVIGLGSWFAPIVIGFSILLPIAIYMYNRKINK